MLPNESLLQVLRFADYKTLVLAKLAGARFLRVSTKFAGELARHRSFRVTLFVGWIAYGDVTINLQHIIRYDLGNQPSLAAACREVAGAIGPHAVASLTFYGNTWDMRGVGVIFEAAPPLKYAENVVLHGSHFSTVENSCEAFMHHFAGQKELRVGFDSDTFCQFTWTFLRQQSVRGLRLVKWSATLLPSEVLTHFVEELVRYCITLPRLLDGEAMELDFSEHDFSGAFGRRIIELLKDSGCELTFRMKIRPDGNPLTLDESNYTVDLINSTTRYASKNSAIVVEVNGHLVAIQSTAQVVPRKKPRTNGEVLPMIPFAE